MRKIMMRLVDATLVPLIEHVLARVRVPQDSPLSHWSGPQHSVLSEVVRRAVADSADYADAHMPEALCVRGEKEALWRYAFAVRARNGLIVEFGVFQGQSIKFFSALTSENIYGFDSFEGLAEDWKGWAAPRGTFNMGGRPPTLPNNVTLIKGWFDQTLPPFLREHGAPFSFVHIDSDTYEAAASIFAAAAERFRPGTVVVFDQYFGYRGWRLGEWKAWHEFTSAHGLAYKYLAFHDQAVALMLTGIR
jgi:hypothetical protein